MNNDDIIVTIEHPHGIMEIPLSVWIANGPGQRKFLQPKSAKDTKTGKQLSLNIIPFRYRNTPLTRLLISLGLMRNPWMIESITVKQSKEDAIFDAEERKLSHLAYLWRGAASKGNTAEANKLVEQYHAICAGGCARTFGANRLAHGKTG